jgi:hypothetical protein
MLLPFSPSFAAVVRHQKFLAWEKLPQSGPRPPGIVNAATAAAAFDAPEFISGTVSVIYRYYATMIRRVAHYFVPPSFRTCR